MEPQRGITQQVLRRQNRENSPEFVTKQHFPAEEWLALMPTAASGGWVLRLKEQDPRRLSGETHLGVLEALLSLQP